MRKYYRPIQGILLQDRTRAIEKFCAMPFHATQTQIDLMLLYCALTLDDFRKKHALRDQDDQTPRLRAWLLEILITGALSNGLMSSRTREGGTLALKWCVKRIPEAVVYKIVAYIRGPCPTVDLDAKEFPEHEKLINIDDGLRDYAPIDSSPGRCGKT